MEYHPIIFTIVTDGKHGTHLVKMLAELSPQAPCHSQAEKHVLNQLPSRLIFENYRMLLYFIQVAQSCFLITVLGVSHSVCCLGDSCRESLLIAECILKSVLIKDHSSA